jgi:arylsulfatase A-like enzyme
MTQKGKHRLRQDVVIILMPACYATDIGPGESSYTQFDRKVRDATCDWIRKQAPKYADKPWVLFVGFFAPHYPLIAPKSFYDLYSSAEIPPPRAYDLKNVSLHPAVDAIRDYFNYDGAFDEAGAKIARTAYYGLCSFVDDNIGRILKTLEDTGLSQNTRIIYTSDHGDCLGNRGIWAKSVMYEESVAIPLIMAGPGIPENQTVSTPVSLVDCYQTIIESAGEKLSGKERALPGHSLIQLARGEFAGERVVFSEYHDGGSITETFMLRTGQWKYIYRVGYAPQLFDLEADPYEKEDLGTHPKYTDICKSCETKLREIVDLETVNEMAFNDQRRKVDDLGGLRLLRTMTSSIIRPHLAKEMPKNSLEWILFSY